MPSLSQSSSEMYNTAQYRHFGAPKHAAYSLGNKNDLVDYEP